MYDVPASCRIGIKKYDLFIPVAKRTTTHAFAIDALLRLFRISVACYLHTVSSKYERVIVDESSREQHTPSAASRSGNSCGCHNVTTVNSSNAVAGSEIMQSRKADEPCEGAYECSRRNPSSDVVERETRYLY